MCCVGCFYAANCQGELGEPEHIAMDSSRANPIKQASNWDEDFNSNAQILINDVIGAPALWLALFALDIKRAGGGNQLIAEMSICLDAGS